jgi:Concanavalin A-like lectin/glucanases superfamily
MALIIETGITIGTGITIHNEVPPPALFEFNFADSRCYSGSGSNLDGWVNYNPGYDAGYIFDLASDTRNGVLGNIGYHIKGNDTPNYFVNQGSASYFNFDGTSTYIDCNYNGPILPAASSYTIFSVLRVNAFSNLGGFTGAITGGDQTIFGFVPAVESIYPILVATNDSNSNTYVIDQTTAFQTDTWYAVAVTFDNTSGLFTLYVNGVQTAQITTAPFANIEPLYIGTWEGDAWLDGSIGVVVALDRALSPIEINEYVSEYFYPYTTPLVSESAVYTIPDTYTFTVPNNITSISAVVVGGGGGGTKSSFSPGGGDTVIYDLTNTLSVNTSQGFTSTDMIVVDSVAYPSILTVNTDFVVFGTIIDNNSNVTPGFASVLSVDTTDLNNVSILISKNLTSGYSAGDSFSFAPAVVYAEGGYQYDQSTYNNENGGPGYRALPRIGDGGGRGGVVDYIDSWPIGGGGAGGYDISYLKTAIDLATPTVMFDPNQTYLYTTDDGSGANYDFGTPGFVTGLSQDCLTVTALGNNTLGYNSMGTYPIKSSDKVMFSLTLNQWSSDINSMAIGLCSYDADILNWVGGDNSSVGAWDFGSIYSGGTNTDNGYPVFETNGDIVDLAVDSQLGKFWYRVNGGYWLGDPAANPVTGTNGLTIPITPNLLNDSNLYLFVGAGYDTYLGSWTINSTSNYVVPSGFIFVSGQYNSGGSGGDGASDLVGTMKNGQYGGGAGGAGRYLDSGAGGGGTGLFGVGPNGVIGRYVGNNLIQSNSLYFTGFGGGGGSEIAEYGSYGGPATAWNGGSGGFPGGGGGSATGYYDAGNAGALGYKNNYPVTPGQQLAVVVGTNGIGEEDGGSGGPGAARILWDGFGTPRAFPNTNCYIDNYSLVFDPAHTILKDPNNPTTVIATITNNNRTITAVAPYVSPNDGPTSLTLAPIAWGSKVMFSVLVVSLDPRLEYNGIGVAQQSMDLTSYLGDGTPQSGVAFYEDGVYFGDGNNSADPFGAGSIVDIAVDTIIGMIYCRVNGGQWNGINNADPENNIGGFPMTVNGIGINNSSLFPAVTPSYDAGTSTGNQFSLQQTPTYAVTYETIQ